MSAVSFTGGPDYIGSEAPEALAQTGYAPVICDNLFYGHEAAVKWRQPECVDILDREWLDEVPAKHRPDPGAGLPLLDAMRALGAAS